MQKELNILFWWNFTVLKNLWWGLLGYFIESFFLYYLHSKSMLFCRYKKLFFCSTFTLKFQQSKMYISNTYVTIYNSVTKSISSNYTYNELVTQNSRWPSAINLKTNVLSTTSIIRDMCPLFHSISHCSKV